MNGAIYSVSFWSGTLGLVAGGPLESRRCMYVAWRMAAGRSI